LGKRFASAAQETLVALTRLRELIDRYPLRGSRADGTRRTCSTCLAGRRGPDPIGTRIAEFLGFSTILTSVGQCIRVHWTTTWSPRWCSSRRTVVDGAHIRLMAGHELVTRFRAGQVGSSAMPHKMNTRSLRAVNGLQVVLRGYASMAAELAGAQ